MSPLLPVPFAPITAYCPAACAWNASSQSTCQRSRRMHSTSRTNATGRPAYTEKSFPSSAAGRSSSPSCARICLTFTERLHLLDHPAGLGELGVGITRVEQRAELLQRARHSRGLLRRDVASGDLRDDEGAP